jgi:hypothetical protein
MAERLKDNPYEVWCPECGKTLCAICERYDMLAQPDGFADNETMLRYMRGLRARRKKHLATFDHSYSGDNDTSTNLGRIGGIGFRLSQ